MSMFSAPPLYRIHIIPCKMKRKSGCILWSIYCFYLLPIWIRFIRFIGRSVTKDTKHRVTCLDLHVAVSSLFSYILIYSFYLSVIWIKTTVTREVSIWNARYCCNTDCPSNSHTQISWNLVLSKHPLRLSNHFKNLFRARQWYYTAVQNIKTYLITEQ